MSAYARLVHGPPGLPKRLVCYEVRCAEFPAEPVIVCDETEASAVERAKAAILRMVQQRACYRIRVERRVVPVEIVEPGSAGTTDG